MTKLFYLLVDFFNKKIEVEDKIQKSDGEDEQPKEILSKRDIHLVTGKKGPFFSPWQFWTFSLIKRWYKSFEII